MKKGLIIAFISIFLFTLTLVGVSCKAEKAEPEVIIETVIETVTETVEVEKEAEPGEIKVIRFVTPETDPSTVELFNNQIAEYEAMNPDVKIQLELVPLANLPAYYAPNIAAGTPPEVGMVNPGLFVEYLDQGVLTPLDDVIADLGGEDEFSKNLLLKPADGHIYNLPYCAGGPVLYVRSDLCEANNVKIPETWDEWLEAAEALTLDNDGDGVIDIYGSCFPAGKNDYTEMIVGLLTWQCGITTWDENMMPSSFNSPEVITVFEFLKELSQYCPPGILEYSYYETMDAYVSGRVAISIYFGRLLSHIANNAPDILDVTTCTPMPLNSDYNIKVTYADADSYAIFKDSKYPETAKDFVKFITTEDRIADFMLTVPGHILPTTKTSTQSEKFWNDEFVKSQMENIEVLFDVPNYGMTLFSNSAGAQLVDNKWITLSDMINTNIGKTWPEAVVGQALQKYLLGQSSAEEAVKWGQQEMERIIAEKE